MVMSAQQVAAELQRKMNLGLSPTNPANMSAYKMLTPKPPVAAGGMAASAVKPPSVPMPQAHMPTTNFKATGTTPAIRPSTVGIAAQAASQPKPPAMPASTPATPVAAQPAAAQPGQFSYDPNTDPIYQAALASAKANAQSAGGDAMAELNKRGILDSTITGDRVSGIMADAVSGVETNLMPQLASQAYGRYRDDINQKNQDEQLAIQKGQLLGVYESDEMKSLYNEVMQAKQDYANATTPEARAEAHQRAVDARDKLEGMNANAGLAGSDVTYDQALGNQSKFGVQTLEGQRTAYDMSKDNPANQALIISNKIDQLKLDNLPEQTKLELEQLKQQVATGKIDVKTAEYNLKELTDPNSVTNQTKKLQLEMTKIDAKNYPEQTRLALEQLKQQVATGKIDLKTAEYNLKELTDPNSVTNQRNALQLQLDKMNVSNTSTQNALEVQKLKKQIADIGKTPPQSDYEAQMNQVKLDTAKEKLKQLQEGKSSDGAPSKIDAKESTDNLNSIIDDIQSNAANKSDARRALAANKEYLTDADYRALSSWIDEQYDK